MELYFHSPIRLHGMGLNLAQGQLYLYLHSLGTVLYSDSYVWCKNGLKVKVELSLCLTKHHAMKTYWGSGGIALSILDLGTRWR
jgi:hypothetical protein